MNQDDAATTLCDLPDELLLHVTHQLRCTRSLQPQSTAFKEKAKEKARQCENRRNQLALHALCLTNRHLHKIATPLLYRSFIGSATSFGLKPLELFQRTITTAQSTTKPGSPLVHNLKYVENRLSDYLGNSLYADTEKDDVVTTASRYFSLLAEIVNHAPNIQHLSVVSVEAPGVSFWETVLVNEHNSGGRLLAADHGFAMLESLCLQIHTQGHDSHRSQTVFSQICSATTGMPRLQDLRASGIIADGLPPALPGRLEKLVRLEITECMLEVNEIINLWAACDGLQHIVCVWAFLHTDTLSRSDLYEALLRHRETLQSLHLDMREVRIIELPDDRPWKLGSLRPFQALIELTICTRSLLGIDNEDIGAEGYEEDFSLSEILPKRLKSFVLLLSNDEDENEIDLSEAEVLWALSKDCPHSQSELENVIVQSRPRLSLAGLSSAFEENAVHFGTVQEANQWSPLDMPWRL
ncbi:hypothetical protein FB567DRAFT_346086 [Paraphoma chrysanthemicola]|uniref:F-box domain-containing protein n=1 Tax=Paraphoma chrysanthemicola TaxID=798071 RepID=A0A8K0R5E2_9PLEO|nr:hypothetical protein FB567DRAFT_346086 [Paraphoma chrysanthemicola]